MFFREKHAGGHTYLQIVENRWEDGKCRQRVLGTVGRLDRLEGSGELEALLESGSRFADGLLTISEYKRGELPTVASRRIGSPMVFDRLWQEVGVPTILGELLTTRKFEFPVERAVFVEVLHRLVDAGSDRAGYRWKEVYAIPGAEELSLHHAYRAMAWLGEPAGEGGRHLKDEIEERLFERRRDLFSSLELVFFDTTSIYFEGEGGEDLGRHGHSKDKRPDLKQMIVGVVVDQEGTPLCCELWPGNTADVTSLVPVVDRLRRRFGIARVCIVADRGLVSRATVAALEEKGWSYILGARMRTVKEVRDEVLSRAGRYATIVPRRRSKRSPSPLEVKEVYVGERRYIVCRNSDQAKKDRADRDAIVASLTERLRQGARSLVGNKGYRKYLKTEGQSFAIDPERVEREARYDGKWVLETNTDYEPGGVALAYKELWMVEDIFRSMKSILATRPIYHKTDDAIRGHVFCSFLALLLRKELEDRLADRGDSEVEWADVIRDLDRLELIAVEKQGKRFELRTEARGVAGKVFQAVGVALPPTVRQVA